jgi:uncharacterized protein CbrC (UPF0167 family)
VLADDLENYFARTFHAKPMQWSDEILWRHGHTQYNLRYWLTHVRDVGSFVKQVCLDDVTGGAGKKIGLGMEFFDYNNTVEDVGRWVARQILTRDAC